MDRCYTTEFINSVIKNSDFTNSQLDSILMAVKFARSQLAKRNKTIFTRGSRVSFISTKTGNTIVGQIVEVKRKFVHVNAGTVTWRVPANMLSAA